MKNEIPTTVEGFVKQANRFHLLGIELYPHWKLPKGHPVFDRARDVCDPYGAALAELFPGSGRKGEDVIVYRDETLGKDPFLSSCGAKQIPHEIGYAMVSLSGQMDDEPFRFLQSVCSFLFSKKAERFIDETKREKKFFEAQSAVVFESIVKGVIGQDWQRESKYLVLGQMRQDYPHRKQYHYDVSPYENFSVYDRSPVVDFFLSAEGRKESKRLYSQDGLIRFDLIAKDVAQMGPHLRQHLETMKLFEKAADELVAAKGRGRTDEVMKAWWGDLRRDVEAKGGALPVTPYACEAPVFKTLDEAKGHFNVLKEGIDLALEALPEEPVLKALRKGMHKIAGNRFKTPSYSACVKELG